jgi:hypothetical protein
VYCRLYGNKTFKFCTCTFDIPSIRTMYSLSEIHRICRSHWHLCHVQVDFISKCKYNHVICYFSILTSLTFLLDLFLIWNIFDFSLPTEKTVEEGNCLSELYEFEKENEYSMNFTHIPMKNFCLSPYSKIFLIILISWINKVK